MRLRTMLGGVTAATLLAVGLGPLPAATATADELRWTDCERGDPEAAGSQCATLRVPVDWDHPDGPTLKLAVARRPAREPGLRVGALIFGPGGPGDSGVDRVRTGIDRFSGRLRDHFDIVSFDPRGVGASSPVTCDPELLAHRPSPLIRNRAQFRATRAYNRKLRRNCRAHTGPVFDHLDTSQTVRDLDALRQALGERRLTFHGSSYGTLLGEQYAETFPRRVRAVVLEGVDDHSLSTRRFLVTQAESAQDSFDEFVAWCARTPQCDLHGRNIPVLYRDLSARALRGELADPQNPRRAMTPFLFAFTTFRALYEPDWAGLAQALERLEDAPPPATNATSPFPVPATMEVFCQDWDLPVSTYREYAGHLRRLARAAPEMRYPGALMAVSSCLGAPLADNPQHRLRVHGASTKLLLTNAVHDPATGYNWATNVASQLGDQAVLLTYNGWGHGTYTSSPCSRRAVDRYLLAQVLPEPGARCPSVAR